MFRKLSHPLVLVLVLAGGAISQAGIQKWEVEVRAANPLHWYRFDEAPGTTSATDEGSGKLNGIYDGPMPGQPGFFGSDTAAVFDRKTGTNTVSFAGAANLPGPWTVEYIVMSTKAAAANDSMALHDSGTTSIRLAGWTSVGEVGFTLYGVADYQFTPSTGYTLQDLIAPQNEWIHLTFRNSGAGTQVFINGELMGTSSNSVDLPRLRIGGRGAGPADWLQGALDEAVVYDRALTDEEILAHATAPFLPDIGAILVEPAIDATDVPYDAVLSWLPGMYAKTHDVYLGTMFDEVSSADRANPAGVLVSQGQTDTTYDPAGGLEYGKTYYWRIDEVNGAPDNTVFQGDVWSFTAEPYSYPVQPAAATASSSQPGMGPENTINGSGLTGDLHGVEPTTMWLSAGGQPNWIQYEFGQAYKLDKLQVWNSNQLIEGFLGFGAKTVTVETSTDGATWTPVADVPEFNQAPGALGYAANTTVSLGGVEAKYVKLTITANWGGMAPGTGLAEVRFYYVPVQARSPQPADATTGVSLETAMDWRPGREATSHQVYFSADPNAVTNGTVAAQTVTEHGYTPDSLNLDTTYYWRVDEVGATTTYTGDVWSFTTQQYLVVDDFENYGDDYIEAMNTVFDTWVDGFSNPAQNGAVVGLATAANGTFCDTTIFHGGRASMPFAYDNTAAPLSEAVRTFDTPQDWTANGVKSLSLWFRGVAGNTGQLYIKINSAKVVYDGAAGDITAGLWLPWNIDLSQVGTKLSAVTSLTIGVDGAAAGGTLSVDDIRLYPNIPEFIVPTQPDDADLVGHWTLDEGSGTLARDSSGNGNDGAVDGAQWVTGVLGSALRFDGSSRVNCGNAPQLALTQALSITLWVNPADLTGDRAFAGRSAAGGGYAFKSQGNHLRFTTPGVLDHDGNNSILQLDTWQHVAVTFVPGQAAGCVFYINGLAMDTLSSSNLVAGAGPFEIGHNHWDQWCLGVIDEVRVYDRVLSVAEVAGLAGLTKPLHKPF